MRKIILGRTNEEVSAISLGTWAFGGASMSGKISVGWGGQTESDSKNALLACVGKRHQSLGYRRCVWRWEVRSYHWKNVERYIEERYFSSNKSWLG